jgi:hypothetical protein
MAKSAKHKAAVAAARLAAKTEANKQAYLKDTEAAKQLINRMPSFRSARDTALRGLEGNLARSGITGGAAIMMKSQADRQMADQAAQYNMGQGQALANLAGQTFNVAQGADTQVEGNWMGIFNQRAAEARTEQQARDEALMNTIGTVVGVGMDAATSVATGGASLPASLLKYLKPGGSGGLGASGSAGAAFASR